MSRIMVVRCLRVLIRWSPLVLLAWVVAIAYCLVLCVFRAALKVQLTEPIWDAEWGGGPETLLALVSGALGWASISVVERITGTEGLVVLLIAVPVCLLIVLAGFSSAIVISDEPLTGLTSLGIGCGIFSGCVAAIRSVWRSWESD